jgi:hypothetical protein
MLNTEDGIPMTAADLPPFTFVPAACAYNDQDGGDS